MTTEHDVYQPPKAKAETWPIVVIPPSAQMHQELSAKPSARAPWAGYGAATIEGDSLVLTPMIVGPLSRVRLLSFATIAALSFTSVFFHALIAGAFSRAPLALLRLSQ